jgi:anaerobic magnesium-protoporphyrin IX monomethyl ester cyclase
MNILLVCKSKVMENLGVMYLSSVIKKAGHECKIVSINEAIDSAQEIKPDIVGFSIMTGDIEKFHALEYSLRKRKHPPKIIVGGPDPTFFPKGYDWADEIAKGDAEGWMLQYLSESKAFYNDFFHLDFIPWPDRTDFPGMKIRDFITSRGCPYNCAYCYNDRWNKMFPDTPKVRTRSVKDVIAEINATDPDFVYFQDSCFAVNMNWMRQFSELYRREINIPYHCHLRPNQVDDERAWLLHNSGCISTRIALETASPRLRKLINREQTTNIETFEAAKHLRKYKIKLMIQNILCLPTATIEDDLNTLDVNIKAAPSYAWSSIFMPYPGTVLGDMCVEKGWYKGKYEDITDSFFDHSVLDISEEYREQSYYLQKCFALCVKVKEIPKPEELTAERFPSLIHRLMRKHGDKKLYGGII